VQSNCREYILYFSILTSFFVLSARADSCTSASARASERERAYWNVLPAPKNEPGLGKIVTQARFDIRKGEGLDRDCVQVLPSDRPELLKFECFNEPEWGVFDVTHVVYAPLGTLAPRTRDLLSYQIIRYEVSPDRRTRAGYRINRQTEKQFGCLVRNPRRSSNPRRR
jgi:hypothetical protein